MSDNDLPIFIVMGTGGLLALLGFAALVVQWICVKRGAASTENTTMRVPGIGEISTAYPALVFLFVGMVLMLSALATPHRNETVRWTIKTQVDSNLSLERLAKDQLAVSPNSMGITINPDTRTITVELEIEKGKTFEDKVEQFGLTLFEASGYLIPKDELRAFERRHRPAPGQTGLIGMTEHTRNYQLALNKLPAPQMRDPS